jgi:hypothetical protein
MDLLKYLEPMKNLPERFSNLAFWRGVRKLRDEVVNAFEYVDSWGAHIESLLPNGNYVRSSEISLTPNVEFYPDDLGFRIFTLSSQPNGVLTILPILSVVGSPFRINLTTEKTSILIGKHIDAIRVVYLTSDRVRVEFEMPTPTYAPVWFGGHVNGCAIDQCSVLSRYVAINESMLADYQNMTLNSVTIYYH